MARYYVKMPDWDHNVSDKGGISDANFDERALEFRDAVRSALDPDLNATNWLVSDVARWNGTNANVFGYGFTIFHRSGGANTGPAWTWFLPGRNGAGEAEFEDIVQPSQDSNYFFDTGGGTTFSVDGTPGVHYSQFGGTSDPYDFGYNLADGTLPGGDFDTPNTNPFQDLVTFMPSTPLRGFVFDSIGEGRSFSRMLLVADDEKPFIATYATFGTELHPNYNVFQGDIIVPYRPTDTQTHGALSWEYTFADNNQGGFFADCLQVETDTGTLLVTNDFFNDIFNVFNVPFADGTYPWDVIALQNTNYFKGWVDSDVARVMGPDNRDLYSLYDGGNFIKFGRYYCFPYVPNQVVWPSSPGS